MKQDTPFKHTRLHTHKGQFIQNSTNEVKIICLMK